MSKIPLLLGAGLAWLVAQTMSVPAVDFIALVLVLTMPSISSTRSRASRKPM